MPFAIKDAVGKELDSLERQSILRKVINSDWAAPIVAVPRTDGKFRICGDYKVTVNHILAVDQYPLPKLDELFALLAKGNSLLTRPFPGLPAITVRRRFGPICLY